jgi:hypothetical protein
MLLDFAGSVQHFNPVGEMRPRLHFGGRQRACRKSAFSVR